MNGARVSFDEKRTQRVWWVCQTFPGMQRDGARLRYWVEKVRQLVRKVGSTEFEELVDEQVGEFPAGASRDPEGDLWRHRAVRRALEEIEL